MVEHKKAAANKMQPSFAEYPGYAWYISVKSAENSSPKSVSAFSGSETRITTIAR